MSLLLNCDLIEVIICSPSSRIELSIPRSTAISRSDFFAEALSSNWPNSGTQTVNLHSVLPDTSRAHLAQYLQELSSTSNTLSPNQSVDDIGHIYVIAEALLDVEARNRAVRSLYEAMRKKASKPIDRYVYLYPTLQLVAMIYAHTESPSNPMRRLLVDVYYDQGCAAWFKNYDVAPKEFLWDLTMKGFERPKNAVEPVEYEVEEYLELNEEEAEKEKILEKERREKSSRFHQMMNGRVGARRQRRIEASFSEDEDNEGEVDNEDEIEDEIFPLAGGDEDDDMDDE